MIDFACCVKDDCSHYNPGAPEPETEAEKCPVACASVTYVYYDLNESTEVGTTYTKIDDAKRVDDRSLEFSDQCFSHLRTLST